MSRALVLGGGMTGLSAGLRLAQAGWRVELWEAAPVLGGMAHTFRDGDWRLDLGPHKFYSPRPEVMGDLFDVLPESEFLTVEKRSRIRLRGRFLRYPVSMKELFSLSPALTLKCGMSYLAVSLVGRLRRSEETSYEDFLVRRYGRATYELVFAPYARKIWGPPRTLSKQIAESRVAAPSLMAVLRQALFGQQKGKVLSVEEFRYPRHGSGQVCDALAEQIRARGGTLRTGASLAEVELVGGRVSRVTDGAGTAVSVGSADVVISTIPLISLLSSFRPAACEHALAAARALRTRPLILLYLELSTTRISDDNWIFYPEAGYRWNRAFEQKNFSPEMGPGDRTCLCLEITCDEADPLWRAEAERICQEVLPQLEETGLLRRDQVIRCFDRRLRHGYPIYDIPYPGNLATALAELADIENLYAVGRQGSFTYGGMLDCMQMGFRTAEHVESGGDRAAWRELQSSFQNVEVVD